jgi:4a-hydroxytetrahydrobiopterin dehydratase
MDSLKITYQPFLGKLTTRKASAKNSRMNQAMNENEIQVQLKNLPYWSWEDDKLCRDLEFPNFKESISFVVKLSFEAEQLDHHPEIYNCYNKVKLSLTTHDAGSKVTGKDFQLAHAIEGIC